ncbi:MAG: hypothetical protein J0H34_09830 [Rhizobiales bacterium]|nr:hypothetical protein [Hyphomicrobiales bacterium]
MFGRAGNNLAIRPRIEDELDNPFFPALTLRRSSNRRPMIVFALLSGLCLGAIALIPGGGLSLTAGSDVQAVSQSAQRIAAQTVNEAEKSDRLKLSEKPISPEQPLPETVLASAAAGVRAF